MPKLKKYSIIELLDGGTAALRASRSAAFSALACSLLFAAPLALMSLATVWRLPIKDASLSGS
jgi:hypothetical protein